MDQFEFDRQLEEVAEALGDDNPVRALAILDQLGAARPGHAMVSFLRARALLDNGRFDEAVDEARRAVELVPDADEAHFLLGQAAWQAQRLMLAQQSLERAVELSGRQPRFLIEYAQFMASERGPKLAEKAALEAVHSDVNSATAWAALGLAEYKLHRFADADKSMRRALELDPNDSWAQSIKVLMLKDRGQDDQAAALTRLLEDSPGSEQFVAEVRQDLNRRRAMRTLMERDEVQQALASRGEPFVGLQWTLVLLLAGVTALWIFGFTWPVPLSMAIAAVLFYRFRRRTL